MLSTVSSSGHVSLTLIGEDVGGSGRHFREVARFRLPPGSSGSSSGSRIVWRRADRLVANLPSGLWEVEVATAGEGAAGDAEEAGIPISGGGGQLPMSGEELEVLRTSRLRLKLRRATTKLAMFGDPCGLVVLPGGTHVAHVAVSTTEVFRVVETGNWVRIALLATDDLAHTYDAICVCTRGRPAWARTGPLADLSWKFPAAAVADRFRLTPAMLAHEVPVKDTGGELRTFIFHVASGRKTLNVIDLTDMLRADRDAPVVETPLTSDHVPQLHMQMPALETGNFSLAAAVADASMYEGVGCQLEAAAAAACTRRRWIVLGGQSGNVGFVDASDNQPVLCLSQYTPDRTWGMEASHIYGIASLSGGGVALAGVGRRTSVWFAPDRTWTSRRTPILWRWCGNVQRRRRRRRRRQELGQS